MQAASVPATELVLYDLFALNMCELNTLGFLKPLHLAIGSLTESLMGSDFQGKEG